MKEWSERGENVDKICFIQLTSNSVMNLSSRKLGKVKITSRPNFEASLKMEEKNEMR